MGRVNDPNYYHYHRIINHPMEKHFILKDLIMKLIKQGRIHLDLDEVVESNHAIVTFGSFDPVLLHVPPKTLGGICWYYPMRVIETKANKSVMPRRQSSLMF